MLLKDLAKILLWLLRNINFLTQNWTAKVLSTQSSDEESIESSDNEQESRQLPNYEDDDDDVICLDSD